MAESFVFSSFTEFLLDDGTYKNIAELNNNDVLIDNNMNKVEIKNIQKISRTDTNKSDFLSIRYENWIEPLYCRPSTLVLTTQDPKTVKENEFPQMEWKKAGELTKKDYLITKEDIHKTSLKETFEVFLTTETETKVLKPTGSLGFIVGTYTGYGHIVSNEDLEEVRFQFGPNEELVKFIEKLLCEELCSTKTSVCKEEFGYTIHCSDKHIVKFFEPFGDKLNRTIPKALWASEEDYVAGLYHGLVEFCEENYHDDEQKLTDPIVNSLPVAPNTDNCPKTLKEKVETKKIRRAITRFITVSKNMAIIFMWVCGVLGIRVSNTTPIDKLQLPIYPFAIWDETDAKSDSLIGRVCEIRQVEMKQGDLWSIELKDNAKSVIVNNVAVRV